MPTDEQVKAAREWLKVHGNGWCGEPGCTCSVTELNELASLLERREREAVSMYRWRPIAEIHEDFGPCVVMRIDDPGSLAVMSSLDENFDESDWTHFALVPRLTNEDAARLKERNAYT